MDNTMIGAASRAQPARAAARPQQRRVSRWLIPVGGGLLSAVLIVVGTPHVAWYLRLALALIAFGYIGGQSAAYLWSSHSDQG
jgi:hypothetical protein